MRRRLGLVAGVLVVAGCAGLAFDLEHSVRFNTDCPDLEPVQTIVYPLRGGGTLTCRAMRVVSGPPYPSALVLECTPPFVEPPRERRGAR